MIALCDTAGSGATARVVAQYTFDAYGSVVSADYIHNHPVCAVGHKGLFFDRIDVGVADPLTYEDNPIIAPGGNNVGANNNAGSCTTTGSHDNLGAASAVLLGHARNRVLHTNLGRWLTRDPNGSDLSVVRSLAFHGKRTATTLCETNLGEHLGDGINVHQYAMSKPLSVHDPFGLFGFLDVMGTATTTAQMQSQGMDATLNTGLIIMEWATIELYGASLDMIADVEWASDWSLSDDDYAAHGQYTPDHSVPTHTSSGSEHAVAVRGVIKAIGHHLMTNKNRIKGERWTRKYIRQMRLHGVNPKDVFNHSANILKLKTKRLKDAHKGAGHPDDYHKWIMKKATDAMRGKSGAAARDALRTELERLKGVIELNPDILRGKIPRGL